MFTQEEVNLLIDAPKLILIRGTGQKAFIIEAQKPFQAKYELITEKGEYKFLLEINQSRKYSVKLSVHSNESESKTGLLRVDYFGTHKNPETIVENLPEIFHKYAGKSFGINEHHVHFYVEGYKDLVWALPLSDAGFSPATIENQNDVHTAILEFSRKINIITEISFQESLQL